MRILYDPILQRFRLRDVSTSGGTGSPDLVAENYDELIGLYPPDQNIDKWAKVKNSQGTNWLWGSWGGTFYNSGLYYCDGVDWKHKSKSAFQATQTDVDAGIIENQFVSPKTFNEAAKWVSKADSIIVSTGIISGGVLTINSGDNTKFDISAGKGFIADQSTTPITVTEVEWSAKTAVTLTNLTTSFATDIAIDVDGNVIQQNSFTPEELRSLIFLGGLDHSGGTIINNVFSVQIPTNGIGSSLFELTKAIGDINLSGNVFSPNGANLKVNKSSGSTFSYGRNNTVNSENPHTALQSGQTALSFNYVFNNGSGSGSFLASTTDVDTTKYDDGSGTLATVGNNDWSIQRILMFSNTANVFIQYGTQTFNNKSAATAGIVTTTFPSLSGIRTALVRGYLIVKKGATALNSSDAVFVDADRFGGIGNGIAGNIAQAATQTDVDAGIIDNQFVSPKTFNDASKWDTYLPLAGGTLTGNVATSGSASINMSGNGTLWLNTNNILRISGRMWLRDDEYSTSANLAITGQHKIYTGSGGHTLTLPSLTGATHATFFIENIGTGDVTISRGSTNTIDLNGSSVTSFTVAPGEGALLMQRSAISQWIALYMGGRKPSENAPLNSPVFTGLTTLDDVLIKRVYFTPITASFSGTYTSDLSLANIFILTMTDTGVLDFSNAQVGSYTWIITTSGHTLTLAVGKFQGEFDVAGKALISGIYDGSKMIITSIKDLTDI
jgi:hypothetical protein